MIGLEAEGFVVLCSLGAIQVLGLVSAAAARLSEGSRCQRLSQRVFLGWLGVVGGSTILSLGLWPPCWLASGATFSVMVLTVTCDFGRSCRATTL